MTIADTKDVAVRLTGLNEVGTAIIGKLSSSDSLADINMLCHSIDEACPFGYEDMTERLSASDARSAKELMQVVEEFNQLQQTQKMGGYSMNQHPKWLEFLREQFPPGTRIRLTEMKDPYAPVPSGTEGTVDHIDDQCQFQMKWDNDRTLALIPGVDRFSVIPRQLQTLKLYMPLTVKSYERNQWGDLEDVPVEFDDYDTMVHADSILAAILKEQMPGEAERGLMKYYHEDDGVSQKVQSFVFTVEEVNSRLMGVAECRVHGELTDEELEQLKDYISGQASDGFGEGFEQRPIKTTDGEIYVSLWSSEKKWSILSQDELEQSQQMGGMKLE